LFPKLKKKVKEIDILELPYGKSKSYFNVKVKDYEVTSVKKNKKIYY